MTKFSVGDTVFLKSNPSVRGFVIDDNHGRMNDSVEECSHIVAVALHPDFVVANLQYCQDLSGWRKVLLEKKPKLRNIQGFSVFI